MKRIGQLARVFSLTLLCLLSLPAISQSNTIEVSVKDTNGTRISNRPVTLVDIDKPKTPRVLKSALTDQIGRVRFTGVAPGAKLIQTPRLTTVYDEDIVQYEQKVIVPNFPSVRHVGLIVQAQPTDKISLTWDMTVPENLNAGAKSMVRFALFEVSPETGKAEKLFPGYVRKVQIGSDTRQSFAFRHLDPEKSYQIQAHGISETYLKHFYLETTVNVDSLDLKRGRIIEMPVKFALVNGVDAATKVRRLYAKPVGIRNPIVNAPIWAIAVDENSHTILPPSQLAPNGFFVSFDASLDRDFFDGKTYWIIAGGVSFYGGGVIKIGDEPIGPGIPEPSSPDVYLEQPATASSLRAIVIKQNPVSGNPLQRSGNLRPK